MSVWILHEKGKTPKNKKRVCCVVAANDEIKARMIAAKHNELLVDHRDWLSPEHTTCRPFRIEHLHQQRLIVQGHTFYR